MILSSAQGAGRSGPGVGLCVDIPEILIDYLGIDLGGGDIRMTQHHWMDFKSAPFSSKWAAKEWRRVCGVISLWMPALS